MLKEIDTNKNGSRIPLLFYSSLDLNNKQTYRITEAQNHLTCLFC